MSATVLGKRITTPGASVDAMYDNDGQQWASVQAYLAAMDAKGAEIPLHKTILISTVGGVKEYWNPASARVFVEKNALLSEMTAQELEEGSSTEARGISAKVLADYVDNKIGDINTILENL